MRTISAALAILSLVALADGDVVDAQTIVTGPRLLLQAQSGWDVAGIDVGAGLDGAGMLFFSEFPRLVVMPPHTLGTVRIGPAGYPVLAPFRAATSDLVGAIHIAGTAEGGYVTSWRIGGFGAPAEMRAHHLGADGHPLGGSFVGEGAIAVEGGISATGMAVTSLADRVVHVWLRGGDAFGAFYDFDGTPRGLPFSIGLALGASGIDVAPTGDGGFVVAFGPLFNGAFDDTRARRFTGVGIPVDDAFDVADDLLFGDLAVSPVDDTIAIVGFRPATTPPASEVWVLRFTANGAPLGPEILVHQTTDVNQRLDGPRLEYDLGGNLYVTWIEGVTMAARGYDASGAALGSRVELAPYTASQTRLARLDDGRFLHVWERFGNVQGSITTLCVPGSAVCGDGTVVSTCEQCDDGAANSDIAPDACRTNCRPARCGDGVVDGGETCDDGNRLSCDGCSRTCQVEAGLGCGDGVPFPLCGEACDDANATTGDGCSPSCTLERVPGGGGPTTDCITEWRIDNPVNVPLLDPRGQFSRKQRCRDGDPACDFDGSADGTCTFHVQVCIQNGNLAPACEPGRLATWELGKPSAKQAAKNPQAAAIRAAFASMVPEIVGPNTPDFCSDVVDVAVPLAGGPGAYRLGKAVLKTAATVYDGRGDRDSLQLVCTPTGQ